MVVCKYVAQKSSEQAVCTLPSGKKLIKKSNILWAIFRVVECAWEKEVNDKGNSKGLAAMDF